MVCPQQNLSPTGDPGGRIRREDLVYGDATPVIVEWCKARDEYLRTLKTGTVLGRAEAEQPMLQLETAIIEEHELTLLTASYPR